ncbi:MAG: hypothetical protein HDQ91_07080 [Desulfovibrio sp.]|nr:hypothetical protein [Desulfovibrio sp.]
MAAPTIFTRFLSALGVPHTAAWSDSQFRGMTFKSLYGLSHLLNSYDVPNQGLRFKDKKEITRLTPPFLAQTRGGIFVIVEKIDGENLEYDSVGEMEKTTLQNFIDAWNGIALLAFPDAKSAEPEYAAHRVSELVNAAAGYVLIAASALIFAWFFVTRGLYAHVSTALLALFDCIGLYFSWLLLQKSLNIHTAAADRVCGALERGGCDSIMQLKVSKLFGVFAWSEVGFGYFGVSLAALLLFPSMWPCLALCNVCCLPYTIWSIWYQKFRAKHWCTLCVGVQTTLWCLFFCYLCGGWFKSALPLRPDFIILLATYLAAVLALNRILAILKKLPCNENNPQA